MQRAKYKNNGWGVSQPTGMGVVSGDSFDGTKSYRFDYPEGYNTGSGFLDSSWGGNYRTVYYRAYSKYSSNFVISKSSMKHWEINSATSGSFSGLFATTFGNKAVTHNIVGFQYPPGVQLSQYQFDQNMGSAMNLPTDSQWHCYEIRWTQNTFTNGVPNSDGIIEAWIDGVQRWSYSNKLLDPSNLGGPSGRPNNLVGTLISSYWNCAAADANGNCVQGDPSNYHPAMQRWDDNFVVSTQRIGCLGAAPPPPSNTQPNAPLTPTLSGLRQWLASLVGGMWPAVTRLATIRLGWSQ